MTAPNALQSTVKLYQSVMDEVVANVKETFLDEGIDEAVLQELKQIWETKVLATKVVDTLNPAAVTSAPVSTIKSTHQNNNQQNSNNHQSGSKQQQQQQQQNEQHKQLQQEQQAQQQQNLRSELPQIQYNPGLNVRPRPVSLIQHVPPAPAAAAATVVTPNPMAAVTRGLPQSVITNAHGNVFMQLPGVPGTSIRMIGPQIPTISAVPTGLPPALTSIMNARPTIRPQQQQQHQQPPPLTMGSNVIVIPHSSGAASGSSGSTGKEAKAKVVIQLDGPGALSDDDDEDILEDEDDIVPEDEDEPTPMPVEEGDALNSEDDEKSSENADEMFEADDVVVCQFEKVNRIRNKWKFVLKDGIINLGRKDYVFNKAIGEAEF